METGSNQQGNGSNHFQIREFCIFLVAAVQLCSAIFGTSTADVTARKSIIVISAVALVVLLLLAFINRAKITTVAKIVSFTIIVLTIGLLLILVSWQFPNLFPKVNEAIPAPTPTIAATPSPTPPNDDGLTFEEAQGKIGAGYDFTILLREDGTVVSFGGKAIDTSNWENIIQVAAYGNHALGLNANGTVVSTGINVSGECDVYNWKNVKQISASYQGSIAVTNDGHVLYTGFNKNRQSECESWTNIEKILGGEDHILGLKTDGTVVASGYSGDKRKEVSGFKNVIAGDAANGSTFVVMQEKDGHTTVEQIGANWANEDGVGGWTDIIDISGGDVHTVGLKKGGTVVCAGNNDKGQCNTKDWTDIVAICAGQYHTVGLRSDGSLVATGQNGSGECNFSGANYWTDN